jgi:hypothetical protein
MTRARSLFLLASFLSACFTVVMRQATLDPLHAAALVSTGSLVFYLPIYLAWHGGARLARLPLADITVQAIFQGVLVTIVSLLLYGHAVGSSARPVAQPLEPWCRRCPHCLP